MLQYIIWDVNPEIFHLGSFSVRWYGLLFAAGFLVGMQIMTHIFKKEGKPLADTDTLLIYMVVSIVLGARIGHFAFYEPEVLLRNPLGVILPPYMGLASHGAFVATMLGLWLYSRRKSSRLSGQTFAWVTDRIVITAALGGAFIRLGNLMNSEILGTITTKPWGFVFMNARDEYPIYATPTSNILIARHPAQLYEAISCFILFFILLAMWNRYKQRTPDYRILGFFLVWVFTLRFFYEFIKEDQVAKEATMTLNIGQQLSIPVVIVGLYFLIRSYLPGNRPTALPPDLATPVAENR